MRIEIRSSDEQSACGDCGATELYWTGGKPVAADLVRVMEREMIRRELGLAKVMREHLEKASEDAARRERSIGEELARQVAAERWQLEQAHAEEIALIKERVGDLAEEVAGWQIMRRRRMRKFALQVEGIIDELVERTKYPAEEPTPYA